VAGNRNGALARMSASSPDALALSPFFTQMLVGMNSFHEQYFVSNAESQVAARWGDYFRRLERYAVYWAHYENNVYRKVHLWSDLYKSSYGLYSFTRSIYSPAYRLAEFWATHLMGGCLDPAAGDGVATPSALPIVTKRPALRPMIAQIWRDSTWQSNKETFTRFGAVMGDVGLMAVDDPINQFTYLKVIHPQSIRQIDRDARGNLTRYVLEELRPDPEYNADVSTPALAYYNEVCAKVGRRIEFATYRNGEPYDWRAYPDDSAPRVGPVWTEDYGFVPLRVVQHRDMGLGWGWGELHPSISKLHELDDLASKIDDAIRRQVDCPFLFSGVAPPGNGDDGAANHLQISTADETSDDGAERQWLPTLYATDPKARAHALIQPIHVKECSDHALTILRELERDHPELRADDIGPDASGRARRIAQEKVEAMVAQRRPNYDDAHVRGLQMCQTIGGLKGYPGFQGVDEGSYDRGDLDFSIGDRPVFAVDPMDRIEQATGRANAVMTFVRAGMPLQDALREVGTSEEVVRRIEANRAAELGPPMNPSDAMASEIQRAGGSMALGQGALA
jgi:hypothetical protein